MIKKSVLILVSIALVVYLARQINVREVFTALLKVPPRYLLAAFVLFILGHFSRALRFRILLKDKTTLGGLFSIESVHTAALGFMPLRSGEFSFLYLVKKEYGIEYPVGAAALVLGKALDFMVVVALFVLSFSELPHVPPFFRDLLPCPPKTVRKGVKRPRNRAASQTGVPERLKDAAMNAGGPPARLPAASRAGSSSVPFPSASGVKYTAPLWPHRDSPAFKAIPANSARL